MTKEKSNILIELKEYFVSLRYSNGDSKGYGYTIGWVAGKRGGKDIILAPIEVDLQGQQPSWELLKNETFTKAKSIKLETKSDNAFYLIYDETHELDIIDSQTITYTSNFIPTEYSHNSINDYICFFFREDNKNAYKKKLDAKLDSASDEVIKKEVLPEPHIICDSNGKISSWNWKFSNKSIEMPKLEFIEKGITNINKYSNELKQLETAIQKSIFCVKKAKQNDDNNTEFLFLQIIKIFHQSHIQNGEVDDWDKFKNLINYHTYLKPFEPNSWHLLRYVIKKMSYFEKDKRFFKINVFLKQQNIEKSEIIGLIMTFFYEKENDSLLGKIYQEIISNESVSNESSDLIISKGHQKEDIFNLPTLKSVVEGVKPKSHEKNIYEQKKEILEIVKGQHKKNLKKCLNTLRIAACFAYLWLRKENSFNDESMWF